MTPTPDAHAHHHTCVRTYDNAHHDHNDYHNPETSAPRACDTRTLALLHVAGGGSTDTAAPPCDAGGIMSLHGSDAVAPSRDADAAAPPHGDSAAAPSRPRA